MTFEELKKWHQHRINQSKAMIVTFERYQKRSWWEKLRYDEIPVSKERIEAYYNAIEFHTQAVELLNKVNHVWLTRPGPVDDN